MKFAIITYILHKEYKNAYYSYEPYIREMNLWAKGVRKFIVVAPRVKNIPDVTEESYNQTSIEFHKIPQISLFGLVEIVKTIINIPIITFQIFKVMKLAEHIHLRCPGNISLIGCFVQILFPKTPKTAKYAGNWDPNAKQPWSYNLQKKILSNTSLSKNIKVLVYGQWENQSKNIVPFFTASFSENEMCLIEKEFSSLFKFIFVGSLNDGKRPLFAIKIIEQLLANKIPVTLEMYGDGFLNEELSEYIKINNLEPFVKLMGNQKLEVLKNVYKSSHFLILASKSEGWPKAIAEAMFFGCIPISTSISCVPWMLNYGKRGILIPTEIEDASRIIMKEISNLDELKLKSKRAQEWSQQYTLEKFEHEIQKLLYPVEKLSKKNSSFIGIGKGER